MRKIHKKAQVGIHFNWIFVLIIGAVILTFFIVIINKQRTASNQKLASELLSEMELILTGQGVSVGREDLLDIPNIGISFDCDQFGMFEMYRRSGNAVIFAPTMIKSKKMLTWTLSWDVPFKVTNFIYLSSPDNKYYIVYEPAATNTHSANLAMQMNKSLPDNLDYEFVPANTPDFNELKYENNPKVRFVFVLTDQSLPADFHGVSDIDVSAVRIDESDYGRIEYGFDGGTSFSFFKKDGNSFIEQYDESGDSKYNSLGIESAFAALFADDSQFFRCSMEKAMKRMTYTSRVYSGRSEMLANVLAEDCGLWHQPIFEEFDIDDTDTLLLGPAVEGIFGEGGAIQRLRQRNLNAIRASCPTLY